MLSLCTTTVNPWLNMASLLSILCIVFLIFGVCASQTNPSKCLSAHRDRCLLTRCDRPSAYMWRLQHKRRYNHSKQHFMGISRPCHWVRIGVKYCRTSEVEKLQDSIFTELRALDGLHCHIEVVRERNMCQTYKLTYPPGKFLHTLRAI